MSSSTSQITPPSGQAGPPVTVDASRHPSYIIIDEKPASSRIPNSDSKSTVHSDNVHGTLHQRTLYLQPQYLGEGATVPILASVDVTGDRKTSQSVGHVYFDVDKTDLKTAGSVAAQQNRNDAEHYLDQQAQEIIATLLAPGNESLHVTVKGKASWTAHGKIDHIKHADGTVTDIDHNLHLSQDRAQHVYAALTRRIGRTHPELLPLISMSSQAVGDTELDTHTLKENNENRNVTISLVRDVVSGGQEMPRVLSLTKANIEGYQQFNDNHFTYDLGLTSDVARAISSQKAKPAVGSILFESTDLEKPLNIDVSVQNAKEFRLLLPKKENQHLSYKIAPDGAVTAFENGKPFVVLHYQTADGQPPKEQHILISTVDLQKGKRGADGIKTVDVGTYAARDRLGEAQDLAVQQTAEKKATETKKELLTAIDENHDGIITANEVTAYSRGINIHKTLEANGKDVSDEQVQKNIAFWTKRHGDASGVEYEKAVRQIVGYDQKDLAVSKEQFAKTAERDAMFGDMLKRNDFKMPSSGGLAMADIGKQTDPHTPPPPAGNMTVTVSAKTTHDHF